MTVPYFINEHQSDMGGMGWRTTEILIRAVFESVEMPHRNLSRIALVAADHIECPECGGEHVRPCTMNMAAGNGLPTLARPAGTNSASKR
jgi:hypothetical protein